MTIIQLTHTHCTMYQCTPKTISIFTICVTSISLSFSHHRKKCMRKMLFIRNIHDTYTYTFSLTYSLIRLSNFAFEFMFFSLSLSLLSIVVSTWFDYQLFVWVWYISWNGFAFSIFFRNFRSMAFCSLCFLQTYKHTNMYREQEQQFIDCVDLRE